MIRVLILLCLALPAYAAEPSRLTDAARHQIGVTTVYDPSYTPLAFPGGDLPRDRGVGSDVVVRALRDGWGIDLQLAVNRDMQAAFTDYPPLWGARHPDRNIDHRRVANLQTLFARLGTALPLTTEPTPYLPGDIVTWSLPGNLAHIGIVSDRITADGTPLILHNIGHGAQEDNILFTYPMTGHYRIGSDSVARLRDLVR